MDNFQDPSFYYRKRTTTTSHSVCSMRAQERLPPHYHPNMGLREAHPVAPAIHRDHGNPRRNAPRMASSYWTHNQKTRPTTRSTGTSYDEMQP